MARAAKLCSNPTCANIAPCEEHPKIPWAGSTRRTELPKDWERIRRRILQRDPICSSGVVCKGLALSTDCHHTGSPWDHSDAGLAGVCRDCHKTLTGQQAAEARRSR